MSKTALLYRVLQFQIINVQLPGQENHTNWDNSIWLTDICFNQMELLITIYERANSCYNVWKSNLIGARQNTHSFFLFAFFCGWIWRNTIVIACHTIWGRTVLDNTIEERDPEFPQVYQKQYPVSLKENSFSLLANSISVAAAPGIIRLSLHIA